MPEEFEASKKKKQPSGTKDSLSLKDTLSPIDTSSIEYMCGFGNHFASEAIPDTLPFGQNSPQKVARGLYAEQLSGSPFSALRHENLRSWLYRIHPSVLHGKFLPIDSGLMRG